MPEWEDSQIEKILATASGGPFRKHSEKAARRYTKALKHPNWDMGAKVTIDSTPSLMNKGLEMIEAKWLFGVEPDQIEVVVHPQSIIHSMVQFRKDYASIIARWGLPDAPSDTICTCLSKAVKINFERLDFFKLQAMTFRREHDFTDRFHNLTLL